MNQQLQKRLVFLSHSSKDKVLVDELLKQIKIEVGNQVEVFASTRPTAIRSGFAWFEEVIKNLEEAQMLVILLTPEARSSIWVGFEFGFFWKKSNRQNVHILRHPRAQIPSPLDRIQAKLITDRENLDDFFEQFCGSFGKTYDKRANLDSIAEIAQSLDIHPPDRTFKKFEELVTHANWVHGYIDNQEVWTCEDDVMYQILQSTETEEFFEPWTKGFPDSSTFKWRVYLKVASATIIELAFVSLDGGRYFVPIPEPRALSDETVSYFWDKSSLRFKVGRLIGHFYILESLEAFAKKQGIEIIDSSTEV